MLKQIKRLLVPEKFVCHDYPGKRRNINKVAVYDSFSVEKGDNPGGGVLLTVHGFPTSSHDWSKVRHADIQTLTHRRGQTDRQTLTDTDGLILSYPLSDICPNSFEVLSVYVN